MGAVALVCQRVGVDCPGDFERLKKEVNPMTPHLRKLNKTHGVMHESHDFFFFNFKVLPLLIGLLHMFFFTVSALRRLARKPQSYQAILSGLGVVESYQHLPLLIGDSFLFVPCPALAVR